MAAAEVEELEHPLLLGGGTTGLINLERLKFNLKSESHFISVGIVTKKTGQNKIVVFIFMEYYGVYYIDTKI